MMRAGLFIGIANLGMLKTQWIFILKLMITDRVEVPQI